MIQMVLCICIRELRIANRARRAGRVSSISQQIDQQIESVFIMSNKSKSTSVAARILKYLKTGADITENQAKSRFGIVNVRARMSELRQAGFAIYLNEKTTKSGDTIKTYRLGTPSRLLVAAGNAVMSNPGFSEVLNYAQLNVDRFSGSGRVRRTAF